MNYSFKYKDYSFKGIYILIFIFLVIYFSLFFKKTLNIERNILVLRKEDKYIGILSKDELFLLENKNFRIRNKVFNNKYKKEKLNEEFYKVEFQIDSKKDQEIIIFLEKKKKYRTYLLKKIKEEIHESFK